MASPPARADRGKPPVRSSRRFFLAAMMAKASSSASGAMITSVKISTILAAALRVERTVHGDDAAEGRNGVAGQRLLIGRAQALALRHAARIGVL